MFLLILYLIIDKQYWFRNVLILRIFYMYAFNNVCCRTKVFEIDDVFLLYINLKKN